jgi:hypothetical protein
MSAFKKLQKRKTTFDNKVSGADEEELNKEEPD